jgi:nitronate monooxygenase
MGVAISSWTLARAVSLRGQLGVVSGTGIDSVLVRRLQEGDVGGHVRRAFDRFPIREMAEEVWERYFISGGKAEGAAYKSKPVPSIKLSQALVEIVILANFVEVFLAKEGHDGPVGINLLEKIQLLTLPSLYGAMLAGVDYVLMGAGIPREIPAALDRIAANEPAELRVDVAGALAGEVFTTDFDPRPFGTEPLRRPSFLAIVSSSTLAATLAKRSTGRVDGFVVEGATAGGHNAPPRGRMELNSRGEPVYGPRDHPDLQAIRELELPFWLAGSFGTHPGLLQALEAGARGVQVGTPFAFCQESGMEPELRDAIVRSARAGPPAIFTDPAASPTGFPFKVLEWEGTLSDPAVYGSRRRICDLGYLRQAYRKAGGSVGYRCPAEPVEDFVRKGGDPAETADRKCLCNGLLATAGFPQQRRREGSEPPIVTAGDAIASLAYFLKEGQGSYTADDVIDSILGSWREEVRTTDD